MKYNGTPLQDLTHPALRGTSGVSSSVVWRDREAARSAGYDCYDDFADLPRDKRLTIIAEYEIAWRLKALVDWEQAEELKRKK